MSIPGSAPTGLPIGVNMGALGSSPVDSLLNLVNSNPFLIGSSMLLMNLGGRFLSMELSSGQEEFFKHPWVRRILLFVILFMGTRNVMVAGLMWLVVVILIGYVFNENSAFCVFGQSVAPGTTCAGQGVTISGFINPSQMQLPPDLQADRTVTLPPAPSASAPATAIKNSEEPFIAEVGKDDNVLTKEEMEILTKLSKKLEKTRFVNSDETEIAPVVAAPPSKAVVSLPFVEPGQTGPMSSRPGEAGPGWGQGSIPSSRIYDLNAGIVGGFTF